MGTANYLLGYDPAHRVVGITDSRGNKTLTHHWSPGGLLNTVEDSDGHRTDYLYDGVGRLIGIWAPNFDYLAFSHDAGGRLTEKWFPNGTTARYAWNADDSLAELTNRTAANAVLTSHAYSYDSLGRRTRHTETLGSLGTKYLQYGFDALSRLTQVETCTTSAYSTCTADETLTYDIWDNRKTQTKAGSTLAYVFDAAHQLKETRSGSDTGALVASYAYDANGNQTARPGQTLVWNPDNQLTSIGSETYAYDAQDRRIQKTVSAVATNYLYQGPDIAAEYADWTAPQAVTTHGPEWDDPLIRTTGSTGGPDAIARYYHADGLGSAVAMSGNSQTRVNVVVEAGVTLTEGSGGSYTVGGVASSAASLKNGDRSAASGHWTVTSGRTLDIVFAGSREIEEVVLIGNPGLTNNPQPQETDTYATASSFDTSKYTVQTWNGTAWVTQATVTGNKNVIRHVTFAPVSTTKVRIIPVDDASNGQTSNDNVVSLAEVEVYTTPEGGGTQVQRFDAWGNHTQSAGAAIPQYGYTGREPDATGLIYYRARYYDPTIGRFISRDPAGMPDGVNRYAYVGNDPVNFTDPSGLALQGVGLPGSNGRNQTLFFDSSIANNVVNFVRDAQSAGFRIAVTSDFRTTTEQAQIHAQNTARGLPAARPGTGYHETGFAVDVNVARAATFGKLDPISRVELENIALMNNLAPIDKPRSSGFFPGVKGGTAGTMDTPRVFDPVHFQANPLSYGYSSVAEARSENQADYQQLDELIYGNSLLLNNNPGASSQSLGGMTTGTSASPYSGGATTGLRSGK